MPFLVERATSSQVAAAAAKSAATTAAATVASAAAKAKATATAKAAAAAPAINQAMLVYHLDIGLICFAGLIILLALPRMLARLSRLSAWAEGTIFRRVTIASPLFLTQRFDPSKFVSTDEVDVEKDFVNVDVTSSGTHSDTAVNWSTSTLNVSAVNGPPVYMPSWSTLFPWAYFVLSSKVRPGYSLGYCIILLAYTAVVMYVSLVDVDLFSSPSRLGWVAASQIPVIFILATKNNVLGTLIGMGYEKLNVFHRWAGRLAVLAVNLHALAYFSKWSQDGTIASHMEAYVIWGCIALGGMDVLYLLSFTAMRQTYYQLFYVSHIVAAVVVLVAVPYHEAGSIPYIIAAGALYGFDRLLRLIRTRITTASIRALPELGTTRVEVPSINAGWRAGQHVRLRVLSMGMGGWGFGWTESHPFTIASVEKSRGEEGLVLMVKKAGDWTNKLFELAQKSEYRDGGERKVRVMIQGPYGGPGHASVASFSGAMLVAGGSGITYALSTLQELVQKGMDGGSRVRAIDLAWSMTDPAGLKPMIPTFAALLAQAPGAGINLRISVSYTRALVVPEVDALKDFQRLPLGLSIVAGRPRLPKMLDEVIDRTCNAKGMSANSLSGVVVGVCGPPALGDTVARAVRRVGGDRRRAVGGVELHEEIFGW